MTLFFVCENVNDILVYYILLYQKARMRSKLKFIGFVVHRLGMGSAINPKFDQMYQMYLGVGLAGGGGGAEDGVKYVPKPLYFG